MNGTISFLNHDQWQSWNNFQKLSPALEIFGDSPKLISTMLNQANHHNFMKTALKEFEKIFENEDLLDELNIKGLDEEGKQIELISHFVKLTCILCICFNMSTGF